MAIHRTLGLFLTLGLLGLSACELAPENESTQSKPEAGQPAADSSTACGRDSDCSDDLYCNGAERCDPDAAEADSQGCLPGEEVACDDGVACTLDRCSDSLESCEFTAPDLDGDGHGEASCLDARGTPMGDDCDDDDMDRFPGNTERCDPHHDEDCDSSTFGRKDDDGDKSVDMACCNVVDGTTRCGGDCNDDDAVVAPTMSELCDDKDNDCDAKVDENPTDADWYLDADGDGYGDASRDPVADCAPIDGRVLNRGDCDDDDDQFHPGALELCDGKDNDCDGKVDDTSLCSLDGGVGEDGAVLGCQPSTRRCNPESLLQPQLCVVWGAWENETPCDFLCIDGTCTGVCTPTATRCNGKTPQTCDASGQWVDSTACGDHCLAGGCVDCVPEATGCNGDTTRECGDDGNWDELSACGKSTPYCAGGSCQAPLFNVYGSDFTRWANMGQDYVYARRIQVSVGSAATKLGIMLNSSGSALVMGLYSNNNGAPGTLLEKTAEGTSSLGSQELDLLSEVPLSPGTYWIAFSFDAMSEVHWADDNVESANYYIARTYDGDLPASYAGPLSANVDNYELWVVARP